MKVLLAAMRSPFLDDDKIYPPLGILYLKSALQEQGIEADVTDDFKPLEMERYASYDAFCASVMTPQREQAEEFLSALKAAFMGRKVIIGGPHAKYYLEEVKCRPWDYIVPDDGERVLPKILKGELSDRVVIDKIPRNLLSQYPPPDRLGCREFLQGYHYMLQGRRSTSAMTGRGCPMKCTFCEDARTGVRWQPLDKFRKELDDIVALDFKSCYLFDDLFSISPTVVRPYCDALKERGLIYRCNGHAKFMNPKFAELLASTGCVEIAFGAESGSQLILDNVKKETTVQQNYDFVKTCIAAGIHVKAFIMVGLPGETLDTIKDTERFIAESGIEDFQLSIYYPYKGTEIRDSIDRGDVTVDIAFMSEGLGAYGQKGGSTECVVRTIALSREDLLAERDRLVRLYKPRSHKAKWEDRFRDQHLIGKVEYGS